MKTIYGINAPVNEWASALKDEFFTRAEDAACFIKGAGWYGADGTVTPCHVFESVEEYQTWRVDEVKRAALRKAASNFTEAEQALGIKL